jgi:hypothetical protein
MRNSCKGMGLDYCRFYEGEFKTTETKKPIEFEEFEKAVRPLMKWVAENYDPHTKILISYDKAEILQEKMGLPTEDYIQD